MLTPFIKRQLVAFGILTVISLLVLGIYYLQVPSLVGIGQYTLKAQLPASGGLYPTANVTYRGITVLATGGDSSEGATITIDVVCDPPILLAINMPSSQTVKRGQTVQLSAKAEAGAVRYQWYSGHAGFTSTPIAGATSSTFTTPAINSMQEFWVRDSNACGAIDSNTATITPVD